MKKVLYIVGTAMLFFTSCQSVDFDKTTPIEEDVADESVKNLKDEQKKNEEEIREFQIQEEL